MENQRQWTTHLSLYWKCQLVGWLVTSLYWLLMAALTSEYFSLQLGLIHLVIDVLVGIGLTHAYREIAKRNNWGQLVAHKLIWRLISAVVVLALLYMLLICGKLYLINNYLFSVGGQQLTNYPPENIPSFSIFLRLNAITVLITGIRLMAIWVLAYHLYQYVQREIKATKENARLVLMAKEKQLNNLYAQLNPHFLFNSLNNIKALVIDEPKAARRAIDLLSELLRTSLYRNHELLVTLQDEMSLVNDYLELEKLRFQERLQIKIEVANGLECMRLPPLSILTLVENGIKHGISVSKEGGLIQITISNEGSGQRISVYSPGTLSHAKPAGVGIKNLKERLLLQYEGTASVALLQFDHNTVLAEILIR